MTSEEIIRQFLATAVTEIWPLKNIRLNDDNPRTIRDDKAKKLSKSIKEFPEMLAIRPLIINTDGIVLGGNMRYRAAVDAGLKEVPVIVVDLTKEKQLEFIIKDNVSFGMWDWDEIADKWTDLPLSDWGMDLPVPAEEEPEDKGKSAKGYKLEIKCEDEEDQDKTYMRLLDLGFNVSVK